MAVSPRLIKQRIRSVKNTKKITKAMELVAASKMRKAVQLTQSSRNYSRTIADVVADVRRLVDTESHPLLAGRAQAEQTVVIVAASDRGLCGGFNAQLLKKTLEFIQGRTEALRVITVGRRAEASIRRAGYAITAAFDAISDAPSYERSRPVGDLAYREFIQGSTHRVFLVYSDFRSALTQIPTVQQILPIIPESELSNAAAHFGREDSTTLEPAVRFEPSTDSVLDALLPRLIDMQVYQALLESSASEHAARMLAMRSATDNASSMIDDLTLTFNQARQANITREISEISAGKAAIE